MRAKAPACSGFVWFRWLRPSTWHEYVPMVLWYRHGSKIGITFAREMLQHPETYELLHKHLGPDTGGHLVMRSTLSRCACGKMGPWL